MQYYLTISFFVLHSSEVIFSFVIQMSRQKAKEIETAFFHPLGNSKENISKVINENNSSAFNCLDDFIVGGEIAN